MGRFAADAALGIEELERVVGHGPAARDRARRRAAALSEIAHPGVLAPLELRVGADDAVVAVMPRVDGDDVAALLAARGSLRVGECVTLGIGVASALAAMHRAGLAHGDVAPANVMVSASTVTLVDTMGAVADERGTPGFQPVERDADGASAPGDVYSLGCLLRAAVREADAERVEAWVAPMLAPDPSVRPSAAMVARALEACADPEPIERPMLGVAGAMRARAVSTEQVRTVRRDHGKPWRVWRRVRLWGSVALAVGLVLVVATSVVPRVVAWANPPQQPNFDPTMPIPAHAAVTPEKAGIQLTQARFEAIAAGDAEALRATTQEGSTARTEVEVLAAALETGQVRVEGLAVEIDDVRVISSAGRRAVVEVGYFLSGHTVWTADHAVAYEAYAQTVELDIVWSEAGWQVVRVRPVQEA